MNARSCAGNFAKPGAVATRIAFSMERAAPFSSADAATCLRPDRPDSAETGRLLSLVTSGAWTSVALLGFGPGGELECESLAEPADADQSKRLLAMIGELLGCRGLTAVGAIAFDEGPGAFTGLRIGCAVAQGLGFVAGLPLVPVGSLEAAAWQSVRQAGLREAVVLVANDARMGELYLGLYVVGAPDGFREGPSVRALLEPRVEGLGPPPADISRAAIEARHPEVAGRRWLVAGDAWRVLALDGGWRALPEIGAEAQVSFGIGLEYAAPADARAAAEVGWTSWRAGRAIDAQEAAPRYVRDKVALDVDEQRRLREGRLRALAKGGSR